MTDFKVGDQVALEAYPNSTYTVLEPGLPNNCMMVKDNKTQVSHITPVYMADLINGTSSDPHCYFVAQIEAYDNDYTIIGLYDDEAKAREAVHIACNEKGTWDSGQYNFKNAESGSNVLGLVAKVKLNETIEIARASKSKRIR